jgi:hypothetical protein
VCELLAVAGDHEQGVVDADTKTDHGGERVAGGRHVDHRGQHIDEAQPDAEAKDGRDDGQPRGQERAEHHHQHDGGDGETDPIAGADVGALDSADEVAPSAARRPCVGWLRPGVLPRTVPRQRHRPRRTF